MKTKILTIPLFVPLAAFPLFAGADSQWLLKQSTLTWHAAHPLHQSDGVSHAARGKGVCHAGQCDFLIAVPVKSFADVADRWTNAFWAEYSSSTMLIQFSSLAAKSPFEPLLKSEWVGSDESVLWARSRAGEARRSEPLTAITGPDNRALLNAGMVRHSAMEARARG